MQTIRLQYTRFFLKNAGKVIIVTEKRNSSTLSFEVGISLTRFVVYARMEIQEVLCVKSTQATVWS